MRWREAIPDCFYHWYGQLRFPRAARERRQMRKQERAEDSRADAEQERWRARTLATLRDPTIAPDDLRSIVEEYASLRQEWQRRQWRTGGKEPERQEWRDEIETSLCAHPNLPPDLYIDGIDITRPGVAGLLRNPAFPLILLERPDFVQAHAPEHQELLAFFALRHHELPPAFARMLTTVEDPWQALEARGHRALHPAIGQTDPKTLARDFEEIEAQALALLPTLPSGTFDLPARIYEFLLYGILPSWIPVEDPLQERGFQQRLTAVPPEEIQRLVAAANRNPRIRTEADISHLAYEALETVSSDASYLLAAHPETSQRVLGILATGGDSRLRQMVARHPHVTASLRDRCRAEAFVSMKAIAWKPLVPSILVYLLLRYSRGAFSLWERSGDEASLAFVGFLGRLGLAYHLTMPTRHEQSQGEPDDMHKRLLHEHLLELLRDDTNRYVAAVAQRVLRLPPPGSLPLSRPAPTLPPLENPW